SQIATGFRVPELRSLYPADFKLKSEVPHVTLVPEIAKKRIGTQQPTEAQTAAVMSLRLKGKPTKQPLSGPDYGPRSGQNAPTDLSTTRVQHRVSGGALDFRSLPGTFVTS